MPVRSTAAPSARATGGTLVEDDDEDGPADPTFGAVSEEKRLRASFAPCFCFVSVGRERERKGRRRGKEVEQREREKKKQRVVVVTVFNGLSI